MVKRIGAVALVLILMFWLLTWLWGPKKTDSYTVFPGFTEDRHLGCYDISIAPFHSSSINQKLAQIQKVKSSQFPTQMVSTRNFDKEVNELARAFERHLDQCYRLRTNSHSEKEYFFSLNEAKKAYKSCEGTYFSEVECTSLWKSYSQESGVYLRMREKMQELIKEKEELERKIEAVIPVISPGPSEENNLNQKISELKRRNLEIDSAIMLIENVERTRSIEIDGHKREMRFIIKTLQSCEENKKIIDICIEVSSNIKSLPQQTSVKIMQEAIARKKRIIANQESFIGTEHFNLESYERNKAELKLFESNFRSFITFEEELCSKCSKEKIVELGRDKAVHELKMRELEAESVKSTDKMTELNRESEENLKQIRRLEMLLDDHERQRRRPDGVVKSEVMTKLDRLRELLNQKRMEIAELRVSYVAIRKAHLANLKALEDIYLKAMQLTDCIAEKDYYLKLSEYHPKSSTVQINTNTKTSLIQALNNLQL